MWITRKGEFSASHICRVNGWTEEENRRTFGEDANPNGHGHNFVFEVTVAGEPDPVTGMIVDLKEVKDILEATVIEPMDHRFLNREVPPFDRVVPTPENIAREIWRRVCGPLAERGVQLTRVRLYETDALYVDFDGSNGV